MQEQVKLVVGQTSDDQEEQFYIFNNIILGEGGYGVVKRATNKEKTRELAVKIIPYNNNEIKRKKIEKEINILRILPDSKHLVRVLPIKCYSEDNFYIFMELCKDGTLADYLKQGPILEQQKIFDIFWQLFSGYRVLWENKIVHQDLKLANVLIKNNVLKITDFGFSILIQKYIPSLMRQGTLQYMSLQKLTDPNFALDQKTDVYSLGIMMFQLITRCHPYINQKNIKTQKEYVLLLKTSPLAIPEIVKTFSAPLQGLFDLIVRMVAKQSKVRISCQEIYDYIDYNQIFSKFRQKYADQSKEIILNPVSMIITENSLVVVVPFPIEPEQEQQYVQKIKNQHEFKKNEQNFKIISKIQQWILSLRLTVYFYDRLARRLFIQKIKTNFLPEKLHCYNKLILCCLLLEAKVTKLILQQIRHPSSFQKEDIAVFRSSPQGNDIIKIIRRDEEYIRQQITDYLKRTTQVDAKQQITLIEIAEKKDFQKLIQYGIPIFKDCIEKKANFIFSRNDFITISYLIDGIKIFASLPQTAQKLSLEQYFYKTQTKDTLQLFSAVENYFKQNAIDSIIDETIYSQGSGIINSE